MPIHTTPRWPLERQRSVSLSAYPVLSSLAGFGAKTAADRALDALDVEMRVVTGACAWQGQPGPREARHLRRYPMERPSWAPRRFYDFFAQGEEVVAARPQPSFGPGYLLHHEQMGRSPGPQFWGAGNVTLVASGRRRYELHRTSRTLAERGAAGELRKVGANSIVSLVSWHDEGPRCGATKNVPMPVLYGVCKTFALQDIVARGESGSAPLLRATSLDAIRREVDYSMVPGELPIADAAEFEDAGSVGGPFDDEDASSAGLAFEDEGEWSVPESPLPAPQQQLQQLQTVTCVEPVEVLRQRDATGTFVHVLYPLSQFDGGDVLQFLAQRMQGEPRVVSAVREIFGHALLTDPLTSLNALHQANLFHQDLKPENVLWNVAPTFQRGKLRWNVRADLVDFGLTTPNGCGSMATGTLHTHAPEAFLRWADYQANRTSFANRSGVTYYARQQDDVWAFGLLLLRTLTPDLRPPAGRQHEPWLACPLVADYVLDTRARHPKTNALTGEFSPELIEHNHAAAQLLARAWAPVHAQWQAFHKVKALGQNAVRPHGNSLPTPSGAQIDRVLGDVAAMHFDFLDLLLQATRPRARPTLGWFVDRYEELVGQALSDPHYRSPLEAGRLALGGQLAPMPSGRGVPTTPFVHYVRPNSFADQANALMEAAGEAHARTSLRRHWGAGGSWPRRRARVATATQAAAHPGEPKQSAASLYAEAKLSERQTPWPVAQLTCTNASPRSAPQNVPFAFGGTEDFGQLPGLVSDNGSPNYSDGLPKTPDPIGAAPSFVGSPASVSTTASDAGGGWGGHAPHLRPYGARWPYASR